MKWVRRLVKVLAALVVLLGVGWYFMFSKSPVPETSSFALDMAEVRRLAGTSEGSLPDRLESLIIGEATFPRAFVVAGDGLSGLPMSFTSFRVVYPDFTVVIDTAHSRAMQDVFGGGTPFFEDRYEAMQQAMEKARAVVVTHEHPDHIGGISSSPRIAAIRDHVLLTPEQIADQSIANAEFAPGELEKFKPYPYDRTHALAPGLVLIKAPGHSGGSQLIFVRLKGGAEFLFVGDIAWHQDNIDRLTGRPWLVSALMLKEDRSLVAEQLRTFYDLKYSRRDPVNLIVAHDKAQLENYVREGVIASGFRDGP